MIKEVRSAIMDDVPNIMSILTSVDKLCMSNRPNLYPRPIYNENQIRDFIENPEDGIYILVSTSSSNELTGILFYWFNEEKDHKYFTDHKEIFLVFVCVAEEYRKKGYGKMLFEHAKRLAKENGCDHIRSTVWAFDKNTYDFLSYQGAKVSSFGMEYLLTETQNNTVTNVRAAVMNDLTEIMPILAVSDKLHRDNLPHVFKAPVHTEDDVRCLIDANDTTVFVSTSPLNEITGVLIYKVEYDVKDTKEFWIEDIAVSEFHQRKGYGKTLFEYAKQYAHENGFDRMGVCVWEFNKAAKLFYKHLGMNEEYTSMRYIL